MPQDDIDTIVSSSGAGNPEKYIYETEFKVYEVDAQSEKGRTFQSLSTGPEKIKFLIENGKETTKETGGRIMQHEKGSWRQYNVGQIQYMFRADDGPEFEDESELERKCKELEQRGGTLEEKKGFFHRNATKIREWPERIQRKENLV